MRLFIVSFQFFKGIEFILIFSTEQNIITPQDSKAN